MIPKLIPKLRILFFIFLILFLNGCAEPCIEADNFGNNSTNVYVESNYSRSFSPSQQRPDQVSKTSYLEHFTYENAPWQDNDIKIDDTFLHLLSVNFYSTEYFEGEDISLFDGICNWYGDSESTSFDSEYTLSVTSLCKDLPICSDSNVCGLQNNPDNKAYLFAGGLGLRAAIFDEDTQNILDYLHLSPIDKGVNIYLAGPNYLDRVQKVSSGLSFISQELDSSYVGKKLLFKVDSNFYDNNTGKYSVKVFSGVSESGLMKIFNDLTNSIQNLFLNPNADEGMENQVVNKFYQALVENSDYKITVNALLSIFFILYAINFLIGNIQITSMDLVKAFFKVIIISILISTEYSWNFFYNYLFIFFVEGVNQIKNIVFSSGMSGSHNDIFSLIFSDVVFKKLQALLMVYPFPLGVFYFVITYIIFIFVVFVVLQVTCIYMISFFALCITIILAPLMIVFLLFSFTYQLFSNWLKMLVSFFIQMLLLFGGVSFFFALIGDEVYKTLGFRVCKRNIMGVIYYWYPDPYLSSDFMITTDIIPVPISYTKHENGEDKTCLPYQCIDERYPDLPTLDPKNSLDQMMLKNFHNENFLQWHALLIMIIYLILCSFYIRVVESLASQVSSVNRLAINSGGMVFDLTRRTLWNTPKNLVKTVIARTKQKIVSTGKKMGSRATSTLVHKFADGMERLLFKPKAYSLGHKKRIGKRAVAKENSITLKQRLKNGWNQVGRGIDATKNFTKSLPTRFKNGWNQVGRGIDATKNFTKSLPTRFKNGWNQMGKGINSAKNFTKSLPTRFKNSPSQIKGGVGSLLERFRGRVKKIIETEDNFIEKSTKFEQKQIIESVKEGVKESEVQKKAHMVKQGIKYVKGEAKRGVEQSIELGKKSIERGKKSIELGKQAINIGKQVGQKAMYMSYKAKRVLSVIKALGEEDYHHLLNIVSSKDEFKKTTQKQLKLEKEIQNIKDTEAIALSKEVEELYNQGKYTENNVIDKLKKIRDDALIRKGEKEIDEKEKQKLQDNQEKN